MNEGKVSMEVFVVLLVMCAGVCRACYTFDSATDYLDGMHGVIFHGDTKGLSFGDAGGSAGDVNGDGFDDLFIPSQSGYFLIWGRNKTDWLKRATEGGSSSDYSTFVLPSLDCSFEAETFARCADINGDGFSDILLGARNKNTDISAGCGAVIWGHADPWDAEVAVATDTPGLFFFTDSSNSGHFPVACGDINGDGVEDMFLGTYSDLRVTDIGMPAVVFGNHNIANNETLTITINELDGTNGFRFTGYKPNTDFGHGRFERVGDVNGDGVDDLLFGAPGDDTAAFAAGRAFVIFGRHNSTPWDAEFDVSTLDGTNGFTIYSTKGFAQLGKVTSGAGDLNGDGIADIFVDSAVDTNCGYVIFGHRGNWKSSFSVMELNGTNGFKLLGDDTTRFFAYYGSAVGDMNGDGIDDLVISDPGSSIWNGITTGFAWVLYGRVGAWPATITRSSIHGATGFEIIGPYVGSNFGYSVAGAGDVNGDGIPDLFIGAPGRGFTIGQAYLVFGVARPVGCGVCDTNGTCSKCDAGHEPGATAGTCIACQDKMWSKGTTACQTCEKDGCSECTATTGKCTRCQLGFRLDTWGFCQACTDKQYNDPVGLKCRDCSLGVGCLTCNVSTGLCASCPAGKVVNGNGCGDAPGSSGNTDADVAATTVISWLFAPIAIIAAIFVDG